jgi:hypothetical protein
MIRNDLLKAVAIITLVLLSQPFFSNSAQGQNRRQRSAVANCKEGVKSDWRYEQLASKNFSGPIDAGGGFQASRNCNTVDVTIPGAYSDSLTAGRAHPLSFQLAAAAFVKICNTSARDPEDAMENYFLKANDVRQGSGEVMTEYFFRLNNGRVAHIFSYYNDLFGLMAIIKTSPAAARK